MKSVFLFDNHSAWGSCPRWWDNFVKQCRSISTADDVNEFLRDHKVVFRVTDLDGKRYLDFETEADYLMFVMKFA